MNFDLPSVANLFFFSRGFQVAGLQCKLIFVVDSSLSRVSGTLGSYLVVVYPALL